MRTSASVTATPDTVDRGSPGADTDGAADQIAAAIDQILHQPTVNVEIACRVIGVSAWAGYQAIRKGTFPAPVIAVGRRFTVQSAGLRRLLGIGGPT